MADLTLGLIAIILVLDFVISLWNAYASGVTLSLIRHQKGHTFEKAAGVAGLGLAFSGMAYVLLIVLSALGSVLGLLTLDDLLYVLSFDFLVFGACIIGFGLVVTAQSVAIAWRQRNFGAIGVAAWNVFSEIWDVAIYAEGFRTAAGVVQGDREDKSTLYALIAVAVGLAFLLTYVAYRQGVRKGEGAIAASPEQAAAEADAISASGERHHGRWTRGKVLAAVAAVIVVIVVIAALGLAAPGKSSPTVHVAFINVWAPDNVCGFSDHPSGYDGFDDKVGATELFQLGLHNYNSTACTVHGVTTNTSGFGLSDVQVPVTVPGGGDGYLNVSVLLPNSAYSGNLDLVYS